MAVQAHVRAEKYRGHLRAAARAVVAGVGDRFCVVH